MPSGFYKRTKPTGFQINRTQFGNRKGCKLTDNHKKKIGLAGKGRIVSECTRKKLSKALGGRIFSKETIKKMRESGKIKVFSKKHKENLCLSRKKRIGKLAPAWRGGLSFEEYTSDWTNTLKKAIRQRDNYICQMCGKFYSNLNKKEFSVHHIDYNKKNCDPKNLITLCQYCHNKTNFNRIKWRRYFYEKKSKKTLSKFRLWQLDHGQHQNRRLGEYRRFLSGRSGY